MKIDYKALLIAATVFPSVGAALLAYYYGQEECQPYNQTAVIEQKVDSFITQEEQRLEKELANCKKRFTGNIAEQEYSFSRKWCDMSLKDGKIDQEGYKSCLKHERMLEFENCWKGAYEKSNERMKQYMKNQRR